MTEQDHGVALSAQGHSAALRAEPQASQAKPAAANAGDLERRFSDHIFNWFNQRYPDDMADCLKGFDAVVLQGRTA